MRYAKDRFYIGGEWVRPAGTGVLEVVSPYTEEVVGSVPRATVADMDAAAAAAREALDRGPWPRMAPAERAAIVRALSQEIQARSAEFAEVITQEMGSPVSWCLLGQVLAAAMALDALAEHAATFSFEETRPGLMGEVLVRRVPVGVAACIVPWNVPLFLSAVKLGSAMVAGVPVVLKPAPETPLDSYLLAEAAEKVGVPPGVLNIVPAARAVGEHLVRHPGVDKVSFTGSTAAGRRVGAICGEELKRCTLELGGKSAAIVLDDVDLDAALPTLMSNAIINNGQACLAQTRILAPHARYDEVVDAVVDAVRAMKVGDPMDPEVSIGPLVAQRQQQRVNGYIELGAREGARVAVGGGKAEAFDRGWFVEPTVFADVDNRMRIAREEIFGPVLCLIPYESDEEAVMIANDSDYGLSGSVWTRDTVRGVGVAKAVRTGTFGVNSVATMDMKNPFGGFKASGIGREFGPEGIEGFCEIQTIVQLPEGAA
ncbi:MAG: aldehyde dehydrogenase [Gemmatimonadota bacterium]